MEPIPARAGFTPWLLPPVANAESLFEVIDGRINLPRHTEFRLDPGDFLAREGETPVNLLVLIDGIATVRFPSEDLILTARHRLTPHDVIGLAETIAHRPFHYDVTASTFCLTGVIELSDFLSYLLARPEKFDGALRSLAAFIRQNRKALKRYVHGK